MTRTYIGASSGASRPRPRPTTATTWGPTSSRTGHTWRSPASQRTRVRSTRPSPAGMPLTCATGTRGRATAEGGEGPSTATLKNKSVEKMNPGTQGFEGAVCEKEEVGWTPSVKECSGRWDRGTQKPHHLHSGQCVVTGVGQKNTKRHSMVFLEWRQLYVSGPQLG